MVGFWDSRTGSFLTFATAGEDFSPALFPSYVTARCVSIPGLAIHDPEARPLQEPGLAIAFTSVVAVGLFVHWLTRE